MTTAALDRPMATKKRGRPEKGRNDVSVRLDAGIARDARLVAQSKGKSLAEYLSEITGPTVARDRRKLGEKLVRNEEGGD
jgi:hypothetical protein